ncbi:FAD-dependent oxidoreductase [Anditalea andensis]|uniref:Rieske domain-containing protein n=1 Tax=Anditalea andensis TaxID=1048983 RepID=A0A074KZE6_9BACT|nr:FAD-dependent oxidoreductase [Anditalea andensis]KEO75361.1 hypothetical protein EL17_02140 [Anditalea andensis]
MIKERNSLWTSKKNQTGYPSISSNLDADVCVVGGGITGLTTAILLQKNGHKVILVERNQVGSGTTGYTTGHVTSAIDFYYHKLIKKEGLEKATEVAMATIKARKLIENLIQMHDIQAANYEVLPATYFADRVEQIETLEKEKEAMLQVGIPIKELPDLSLKGSLSSFSISGQGMIDGMGYVQGLAEAFQAAGGKVFENSPVKDYEYIKNKWNVRIGDFFVIADHMVHATHTPMNINPVQMEMIPYNSYAMVVKPKAEIKESLYYDFDSPYHYIRPCQVGGERCYLIGGSDSKTGKKNDQKKQLEKLEEYIHFKFGIDKIHYAWSDMFFEPASHLPYIGKNPLGVNSYIATGFSGDGLTFGTISAMVISSLISDGHHHLQHIFNPARVEFNAIPFILKENFNALEHLVGDRISLDNEQLHELTSGKGIIIKINDQTVGVSMDHNHKIHSVTPVCPHMKCIVQWNDSDQTWDCGCHGSRFDCDGKAIAGPSLSDLPPVKLDLVYRPENQHEL